MSSRRPPAPLFHVRVSPPPGAPTEALSAVEDGPTFDEPTTVSPVATEPVGGDEAAVVTVDLGVDDDVEAAVPRLTTAAHLHVRHHPPDPEQNHQRWRRLCAVLETARLLARVRTLHFEDVEVPDALRGRLAALAALAEAPCPEVRSLTVTNCRFPPGVVRALVACCVPNLTRLSLDTGATRDLLLPDNPETPLRLSPVLDLVELETSSPDCAVQAALYQDLLGARASGCRVVWRLRPAP